MEKSKLGISLNLFAALLYFMGVIGGVYIVMVATAYVLLCEDNAKLKRAALKAFIFTVFWSGALFFVHGLITFSQTLFNLLREYNNFDKNYLISSTGSGADYLQMSYLYQFLQSIPAIIGTIPQVIQALVFTVLGLRAYRQIDVKVKWIDKILDKHF
ncbi:MAG: hypothetical protein FWD23_07040 [Oscillospiraceae bacterium]|nr:hypothetical protein [Oscillospiraceae bacterium]